jgi:hypothetical protein
MDVGLPKQPFRERERIGLWLASMAEKCWPWQAPGWPLDLASGHSISESRRRVIGPEPTLVDGLCYASSSLQTSDSSTGGVQRSYCNANSNCVFAFPYAVVFHTI